MKLEKKLHDKMIVGDFCLKETPRSEVAGFLIYIYILYLFQKQIV